MKELFVRAKYTDAEMEINKGELFNQDDFDTVIEEDTDCFDQDTGNLLFKFRKNILSKENTDNSYQSLLKLGKSVNNQRKAASGPGKKVSFGGICGYFDTPIKRFGSSRYTGVCRKTRFNRDQASKFEKVVPLLQEINKCYKELLPEEHGRQLKRAEMTRYRIADTCFSTITVNHNFRTALHKDKGDFTEGFGNLVIIEDGNYTGGFTGFPRYGVCVDCRTGDYLAMQVHEWHCNTEIIGEDYNRLALVCYLREKIIDCIGHHVYAVKGEGGLKEKLIGLKERKIPEDYIYIFYKDYTTKKLFGISNYYNNVIAVKGSNRLRNFSKKYLKDFDEIEWVGEW